MYSALSAMEGGGAQPASAGAPRSGTRPFSRWLPLALAAALLTLLGAGAGAAFMGLRGEASPAREDAGQLAATAAAMRAEQVPVDSAVALAASRPPIQAAPVPAESSTAASEVASDLPVTEPSASRGGERVSEMVELAPDPAQRTAPVGAPTQAVDGAALAVDPPAAIVPSAAQPEAAALSGPEPALPPAGAERELSLVVHPRGETSQPAPSPARLAASAPDPMRVQQLVSELESAIAVEDREAGRSALDALEALLAAESLTLQRYQAWWAMSGGQDVLAYQRYQRIAERLPGDQNANLNLALLDWRAGRRDSARERIGLLRLRHADSALIERHWRAMNERDP